MIDIFSTLDSRRSVLVLGAAGIDVVGRLEADLNPAASNPARLLLKVRADWSFCCQLERLVELSSRDV